MVQRRARFRVELGLLAFSGILAVLTSLWSDWVETVFGVDPDAHSGSLEWVKGGKRVWNYGHVLRDCPSRVAPPRAERSKPEAASCKLAFTSGPICRNVDLEGFVRTSRELDAFFAEENLSTPPPR